MVDNWGHPASRNLYVGGGHPTSSGHATSSANSAMSLLSEASSSYSNNSQGSGTPVNRRARVPKEKEKARTSPREVQHTPVQHATLPLPQPSRWQKLFSTFKKNRSSSGGGSSPNAGENSHCLKHSHNCSNSQLRAGISNMKGYKKANQDR